MRDIEGPTHVVAIVGGAVSGSVAAQILAEHGCEVVVFEQNDRPYGKIEDGLPRWHAKLRKQEYDKIDARLARPHVHFVPRTRLGRDLEFRDLATAWGFSAVLLANGAWRDRSLEVPGVDDFVGRGLLYQNPVIYWFNHKNEQGYSGPRYDVPDGTLCVGGGLASIDVIKVIQLEIYERALRRLGIDSTMQELEHEGIAKFLDRKAIDPKSLGVTDGMLIYRRRVEDMPLADTPASATSDQLKKAESVRRKILEVCRRKFLFRFEERRLAQRTLVQDGMLVGLTVAQTRVEGKRAEPVAGSEYDVRAPLVIASIGSVPERIPGIRMKGESYVFTNWDTGEYEDIPGVFGIGNVVTGKGNIRDSLEHGEFVAKHLVEGYLGIGGPRDVAVVTAPAVEAGVAHAAAVVSHVAVKAPLAAERARALLDRVYTRQRQVGFEVDYRTWIARVTPSDLE